MRDVGFRTHGKSKDHRADLPQVVIGMAVTRTGIPVRVWCWPGNTSDSALIRQVKDEMREWTLGRVVWVADRGFSSAKPPLPARGGGHYIIGEKLRSGSADAKAALSRQGRYATVADNMQVKEVKLDDADDRFVVCYNPDAAERDRIVREQLVAQLTEKIAGSDDLSRPNGPNYAGVSPPNPASTGSCASPPAGCCASTTPRSRPSNVSTASTCCAPPTRNCPPRTSPWATSNYWKSNAAGAT